MWYAFLKTKRDDKYFIIEILEGEMIRKRRAFTVCWILVFLFSPVLCQAETVFQLDFSAQENGKAFDWFKQESFKLQNDADEIKAQFENGKLVLEVNNDITGLFTKSVRIEGASKVRIEWGVDQYPEGANWEKGMLREAIGVVVSFGDKKIASGSFVVPDVPYFIGIFLGEHEKEGKAYLGNYFKKGGRYFCSPCGSEVGQTVVTEFDLAGTFIREFGQSTVPFISSISFEIDARDTNGRSKAFIKSLTFLSP